MIPYDVITTFGKRFRVYDKVLVSEPVRKYDRHEAPRHGMNYWDGENVIGAAQATRYMAIVLEAGTIYNNQSKEVGQVVMLRPDEIINVFD